ncbi:MAG: hypothetical protein ACH350_07725 [Parachlamydiaceae bacterium]
MSVKGSIGPIEIAKESLKNTPLQLSRMNHVEQKVDACFKGSSLSLQKELSTLTTEAANQRERNDLLTEEIEREKEQGKQTKAALLEQARLSLSPQSFEKFQAAFAQNFP